MMVHSNHSDNGAYGYYNMVSYEFVQGLQIRGHIICQEGPSMR